MQKTVLSLFWWGLLAVVGPLLIWLHLDVPVAHHMDEMIWPTSNKLTVWQAGPWKLSFSKHVWFLSFFSFGIQYGKTCGDPVVHMRHMHVYACIFFRFRIYTYICLWLRSYSPVFGPTHIYVPITFMHVKFACRHHVKTSKPCRLAQVGLVVVHHRGHEWNLVGGTTQFVHAAILSQDYVYV